jgi:hypothetical protein
MISARARTRQNSAFFSTLLDPRTLAVILQAAIDERFDHDLYGSGARGGEGNTPRRAYPAAQPRLMSWRAGGRGEKSLRNLKVAGRNSRVRRSWQKLPRRRKRQVAKLTRADA